MLSEEAKQARKEYMRKWRNKPGNKEKANAYLKDWKKKNPDKVRQYQENYWNKVAAGETDN